MEMLGSVFSLGQTKELFGTKEKLGLELPSTAGISFRAAVRDIAARAVQTEILAIFISISIDVRASIATDFCRIRRGEMLF